MNETEMTPPLPTPLYKSGDEVYLRSGSPPMCVEYVETFQNTFKYTTIWFSRELLAARDKFLEICLTKEPPYVIEDDAQCPECGYNHNHDEHDEEEEGEDEQFS